MTKLLTSILAVMLFMQTGIPQLPISSALQSTAEFVVGATVAGLTSYLAGTPTTRLARYLTNRK